MRRRNGENIHLGHFRRRIYLQFEQTTNRGAQKSEPGRIGIRSIGATADEIHAPAVAGVGLAVGGESHRHGPFRKIVSGLFRPDRTGLSCGHSHKGIDPFGIRCIRQRDYLGKFGLDPDVTFPMTAISKINRCRHGYPGNRAARIVPHSAADDLPGGLGKDVVGALENRVKFILQHRTTELGQVVPAVVGAAEAHIQMVVGSAGGIVTISVRHSSVAAIRTYDAQDDRVPGIEVWVDHFDQSCTDVRVVVGSLDGVGILKHPFEDSSTRCRR